MAKKLITAYHFLRDDMTAGSGDEKAWKVGETRTVPSPNQVTLCAYGYHSCPTLWEALSYAPGHIACLVKVSNVLSKDGTAKEGNRKQVSATRQLVRAVNIDRELCLFAADCAERVLYIFEKQYPNDDRPKKAIQATRDYANGKISDKQRDAAQSAAWAAARAVIQSAAQPAARAAARAAAQAAAWNAAWAAAWNAAGNAAWNAARAAAGNAEKKWQQEHFETLFKDIFK